MATKVKSKNLVGSNISILSNCLISIDINITFMDVDIECVWDWGCAAIA